MLAEKILRRWLVCLWSLVSSLGRTNILLSTDQIANPRPICLLNELDARLESQLGRVMLGVGRNLCGFLCRTTNSSGTWV